MLTDLDRGLDAAIAANTAAGGPLAVGEATIRGVTYPVFAAAPPSMREYLAHFYTTHGAREFTVYGQERQTFAETYAAGVRLAAALQARHGIAKGDRVAIAMRNYPEWIVAFTAVLHLGAVAVPMNAWWQADELAYGLSDSGARLVIADEERARRITSLAAHPPVVAVRTAPEVASALGVQTLAALLDGAPARPRRTCRRSRPRTTRPSCTRPAPRARPRGRCRRTARWFRRRSTISSPACRCCSWRKPRAPSSPSSRSCC